jgi:hypothetical protein
MTVYSFKDVKAAIDGPGGNFPLCGDEAGAAKEGITVSQLNDDNTMTSGADGSWMHSLNNDASGTVTVRLLKASTVNAQLENLRSHQRSSSANWGKNTITIRNVVSGDSVTCKGVAFKRVPDLTYAAEGGTVEWVFDAGKITRKLGTGAAAAESEA